MPAGNLIEGNFAHEFGLYVKQSGFYYQGVSANATVRENVFFNGPRAGINVCVPSAELASPFRMPFSLLLTPSSPRPSACLCLSS